MIYYVNAPREEYEGAVKISQGKINYTKVQSQSRFHRKQLQPYPTVGFRSMSYASEPLLLVGGEGGVVLLYSHNCQLLANGELEWIWVPRHFGCSAEVGKVASAA